MTNEQMRDLVKECCLDWNRGYMPLFEGDDTNRYAVLIAEAMRIEREACAKVCDDIQAKTTQWGPMAGYCAETIRALGSK